MFSDLNVSVKSWRSALAVVVCSVVVFSSKPAAAQLDGIFRNLLQNAAPPAYRPPPPSYAPAPAYAPPPMGDPYSRSVPVDPYPRSSTEPALRAARPVRGSSDSGKFCIDQNSTMLLTRRTRQGIDFALNSWSGRGHLFSISGSGVAEVGGFDYQSHMNSPTLGERCHIHLDIRSDGGYEFRVSEDGPCSESQGFSYPPNVKVVFPAQSRRGGIAPNKTIAEAGSLERGGESCK